ncbi:serine/threonine-protein kinase rio2 [Fagus crenata]
MNKQTLNCDDEKGIVEENQQNSEAGQTNGLETQDVSDKEEDNQTMNSKDTELTKRLKNQNRRVIASMRGGRKSLASRNTYKDKGRRSSQNSKIQKQLSDW